MTVVIVNTLLYLIAIIIYWFRKKSFDLGFVLLSAYFITALCCIFNYAQSPNAWHLIIWPFVYLFSVIILFLRPFLKYNTDSISRKTVVTNMSLYKSYCIIYIVASGLVLYFNYTTGISNLLSADWFAIREQQYAGDVVLYNSQFERIVKIFTAYFTPLSIILAFYYLSINKNKWLSALLILVISLNNFSSSLLNASRGRMFFLVLELFLGYFFFKEKIDKKIKRRLILFGSILLSIILIYTIAITNSRFEFSQTFDSSRNSIIYYFGHSMLAFDYGIADSIQRFMEGDFILGTNESRYMSGFDTYAGTHFGTSFFTFVGALYLDFGPYITAFIALIIPIPFMNILKKKKYDLADVFLLFFAADYLLKGVTVVGRGYIIQIAMTIAIYVLLKYIAIGNKTTLIKI